MLPHCTAIAEHYDRCWRSRGEAWQWLKGPHDDLPSGFTVLRIAPSPSRAMWTYATVCMSQESDDAGLELHLFSPVATPAHVELLTVIAHYHRTWAELGCGHTVNFGRPWLPGSACTHGLISLPYLDGPTLELLERDGRTIRFLWLIPITVEEVAFKKERGLEALERRFEEAGVDYLDPLRRSVV